MAGGDIALKAVSWFLRAIEFCCAAIILAIFSYFLAVLHNHDLHIDTYIRAVEGISGAGILYTIFALILVCCLGGIAFFSFIAMILDLAFTGAFIYLAYATRAGRHSCSGFVNTPLGSGNTLTDNTVPTGSGGFTHLPSRRTACRLNSACFAVAIIGAVFFFLSIFVELALAHHHRKERAFGPSPNNGYTAGTPRRKFWQRRSKNDPEAGLKTHPDALPPHTTPAHIRQSYGTDTTKVGTDEPIYPKYGNTSVPAAHGAAGYHANTNTTGTF
ncbi:hypothetical protein B7494_g4960 [Chlorociboria aeruginascens]|nr:hypothetical protein B7494_g4960 [Chlorociboria aeruginascens]